MPNCESGRRRDLLGGVTHQAADSQDEIALLRDEQPQIGLIAASAFEATYFGATLLADSLAACMPAHDRRVETTGRRCRRCP